MDRSHRFRIPRSKTTRYLQSVIPTAIRTHNQQAGRQTQHATAGDGDAGKTSGDKMEERLGVNRTVAVCVSGLIIWKSEKVFWVQCFYFIFYGGPCNFLSGLIKWSRILYSYSGILILI